MKHGERETVGEQTQLITVDCEQVSDCLLEFCDAELTSERMSAIRDHLVDCDSCRDAVFDVERAVEVAARAGDDYRHPDDFVQRVLQRAAAIDVAPAAMDPAVQTKVGSRKEASTAAARTQGAASFASRVRRFVEQKRAPLLLCAALAAGVLLLWVGRRSPQDVGFAMGDSRAANGERLGGRVLSVAEHFGAEGGLVECGDTRGEDCRTLREDDRIEPGATLRTGGSSLARVVLDDDTEIMLERTSELRLEPDAARRVTLRRGEAIFDVRRGQGERFVVAVPDGVVEVVGTKFSVRVDDSAAWVSVSRGEVVLQGTAGDRLSLEAGQSARLDRFGPSAARGRFEQAFTWGDRAFAPIPDEGELRGLGQLRAQKPGSPKELEGAVTLTRHHVRVDLHGAMARTEVEEVFTNHTDDVLEGIFRFPLPPDARIERLALEVDGRWEEGAFVDRDRAAAIWRGAIVNANRQAPRPKQEIIWVPGPWKDPALLEWQGGGRFDLRVFPIPRRGSRRVLLTYSQQLPKTAGRVAYTYPLAHDPGGSTRVDDFSFEVRVPADASGVNSRGYALKRSEQLGLSAERAHYAFSERSFVPAGDVAVEYAPADVDSEVSAWAYEAPDGQRYALLSLRPSVPLASERAERELVFVVDRSRSMFGESMKRAAAVVERTIAELDPDVRVKVLDCDVTCDALSDDFAAPSAELARRAGDYVRAVRAEGASDVVLAVMSAVSAGAGSSDRDVHVVYVGDGASSVGDVQPAFVRDSIERQLRGRARISAVSVGTHVDLPALRALTRAGGGVVVEYNPGRSAAEVAYALLAATYGAALSDVSVSLPSGLHEITPQRLPTVLPGEPLLVAARMDAQSSSGAVTLRGTVGGERFEKSYDVSLVATPSAGNAFVPRAFAAARIADFEQSTDVGARERIVALSQRFGVASRFTSLLVLESPAMFRAFGLDNTQHVPAWDSDAEAVQTTAGDAVEEKPGAGDLTRYYDGVGNSAGRGAGSAESGASPRSYAPKPSAPAPKSAAKRSAPRCNCPPSDLMCAMECGSGDGDPPRRRTDSSRAPYAIGPDGIRRLNPDDVMPRRMVPMRKVWERHGKISAASEGTSAITSAELDRRRTRFEDDPLRRDALVRLYAGYLLAGELNRAEELVERWLDKDPLDPDALTARADLAAQRGDRALALRMLGSVVDAQPGNHAARFRLARALRWAGQAQLGCRFALASAQLEAKDPQVVARALRCLRSSGGDARVEALLSSVDGTTRAAAERFRDTVDSDSETLSGDFRVEGTWDGAGGDLDLVIVHPDGYRVSWLGAPTKSVITARDVRSLDREGLALRGAGPGVYAIEVVRHTDAGRGVSGSLEILAGKERRRIPFSLAGQRTRVATVTVSMRSTLVPWR